MSDDSDGLDGLGSLAQSARSKQLRSAKIAMIAVGILTIGANAFMGLGAKAFVEAAFARELKGIPADQIDNAKLAELKESAVKTVQLSAVAFSALGVVFIVLGLLVYRAPVLCTSLGLILYLGGWAIDAAFDPAMLLKGILIKAIVIAALVKALKAAIEYQKEHATAAEAS